jgi:hypothetical protein
LRAVGFFLNNLDILYGGLGIGKFSLVFVPKIRTLDPDPDPDPAQMNTDPKPWGKKKYFDELTYEIVYIGDETLERLGLALLLLRPLVGEEKHALLHQELARGVAGLVAGAP